MDTIDSNLTLLQLPQMSCLKFLIIKRDKNLKLKILILIIPNPVGRTTYK